MSSQKRKVILYISHSAGLYGAELCLLDLLTGLDRDRFLPIVVIPENGPLKRKLEELNITVEVTPFIRPWLTRRKGVQRVIYSLAIIPFIIVSTRWLKAIVTRYKADLIHTNTLVIISGALAARLSRVPHVWHARELLIPETVFNFFLGPHAALSIITRLADQVIAISSRVQQTFCEQADCSKVVVIYDGLQVETFEPAGTTSSIRSELGIPADALLIGEVGRISEIKGYEDFVRAAAIVKGVIPTVTFIGVGGRSKSDAAYERRILKLIDTCSLQGSFKLVGYRDDIPHIMSALDLFVLPSHTEASGRVLAEAMAAGKPVIGAHIGGIPEVIEDGVTGLVVPPHSPDDLAQAMITVLRDPELAHRMGANGREQAKTRFSLERHVAEVQQVYDQLTDETQRTDG